MSRRLQVRGTVLARVARQAGAAPVVALVAVAAPAFVFVVPVRALLLGVAAGALTLALRAVRGIGDISWPGPVDPSSGAGWHQASLLESTLSQAAADPQRFESRVAPRLRRLAEARLHRRGIDWDSAPARSLLGAEIHALLRRPLTSTPPPDAVRRVLDTLDGTEVHG
jgi:hypothetical protein